MGIENVLSMLSQRGLTVRILPSGEARLCGPSKEFTPEVFESVRAYRSEIIAKFRSDRNSVIRSIPALIRSKALDHSGWKDELPRGILPSDVDAAIDDNGRILQWEISTRTARWDELSVGQRKLQQNYVAAAKGLIVSALVHVEKKGKTGDWKTLDDLLPLINTHDDVLGYSVMQWENGRTKERGPFPGESWVAFVHGWFSDNFVESGVSA